VTEVTDTFDKGKGPVTQGSPYEAIRAIPVRHYGRWISAVVVVALLVWLGYAFSQGNILWGTVGDKLFDQTVIQGVWHTILISVCAMAMGLVLGVLFAVMRLSKNPVTGAVAWLYIWFFRGTPVYVQLLMWFNLSLIFPVINLMPLYKNDTVAVMTPFVAALLGLGLNEGAYMAEIVRAGVQSVDYGQTEAAHALGMTGPRTMWRIVLPQAMRVIIPPTGNEFINMLKTSSLAYAIQYNELLQSAVKIYSNNLAIIELLFTVSLWYLILTSVFSIVQYRIERRFSRGTRGMQEGQLGRLLKNLRMGRNP